MCFVQYTCARRNTQKRHLNQEEARRFRQQRNTRTAPSKQHTSRLESRAAQECQECPQCQQCPECQGAARRSTAQNAMDVRRLWGKQSEQCTAMARVALCVRPACACSTFHHRAMLGWWMLFCLVWKLNPDFLTTIRFALTETRRTSLNSATMA